jgi:hypothetical protein
MEHTTLTPPPSDLERLDHAIAQVGSSQNDERELLFEHLQSARAYLLGAMPDEYEFSLASAKEAAARLNDSSLQRSVMREVADLLENSHSRPQSIGIPNAPSRPSDYVSTDPVKSELYRFFHGSAVTLGVFYPTHYIFAAFPSFQSAKSVAEALAAVGFRDVLAASAEETARFFEELRAEVGLWGALMASVSRFFGTEEVFADIDAKEVAKGAGFVAVYCPIEEQAEQIRDLAAPFDPLVMQLYLPGGIRTLCAGQFPGPQGNHVDQE